MKIKVPSIIQTIQFILITPEEIAYE